MDPVRQFHNWRLLCCESLSCWAFQSGNLLSCSIFTSRCQMGTAGHWDGSPSNVRLGRYVQRISLGRAAGNFHTVSTGFPQNFHRISASFCHPLCLKKASGWSRQSSRPWSPGFSGSGSIDKPFHKILGCVQPFFCVNIIDFFLWLIMVNDGYIMVDDG